MYISLNRLRTTEEADRKLEKAFAESDVEDFERKYPIIGFIFHPMIKIYFSPKITIPKSQIFQISNYIPKIA